MTGTLLGTRRDVVVAAGAVAAAAAVLSKSPNVGAGRKVSGTVFHDRSGAGVRRESDPGVAGVMVSNGVDVTLTDASGRWRLPWRENGHVFVIKPANWVVPRRRNGLCAFAMECGRDDGLDFPLSPSLEPSRFDVVLLADTQPQTARELDYLRDTVLASIASSGAALAINHGDVVFDAPELYERYIQLVATSGMPWHHCPGNHDMDHVGDPVGSFATWRRVFGPCHYAFQHAGATFILLNNVERLGGGGLTASGHSYRGCIGEEQLAFVRNVLEHVPRESLVVVSMHIPLVGFEDPADPAGRTEDRAALLKILSGRPHTVSFAGHTHTTEHHYLGKGDGFTGPGEHHHHVLTAACGSWWSGPFDCCGLPIADSRDGTPKGYHVLSVDGHSYSSRFVAVSGQANARMRLSIEGKGHGGGSSAGEQPMERHGTSLSRDQVRDARLVVNVFDGGPRTQVGFRVVERGGAGSETIAMTRSFRTDPYTVLTYGRYCDEIKPWVEAAVCSHIWEAKLPGDLGTGCYRLMVECRDEYGATLRDTLLLEVFA